jgi:hypothetical protein
VSACTKAELRTIVRECETMATLLDMPGTLLCGTNRERLAQLLRKSVRYHRIALETAKEVDRPAVQDQVPESAAT